MCTKFHCSITCYGLECVIIACGSLTNMQDVIATVICVQSTMV